MEDYENSVKCIMMVKMVEKKWDTNVSDAVKQMLITYLDEKGYMRKSITRRLS